MSQSPSLSDRHDVANDGRPSKVPVPTPVRAFLEVMLRWLERVSACDASGATFQMDQMRAVGRMLAIDPEFGRIFVDFAEGGNDHAEQGLESMYRFLSAVTSAACMGQYRRSVTLAMAREKNNGVVERDHNQRDT